MKYALIISGALAAIAVAAPMLVVIGYLLILPGLVLTLAPTVFVYLAATELIARTLPLESKAAANAIGFGCALLLGWAVMQPFRAAAMADYQAAVAPDVTPGQPIALVGDVRLERNQHQASTACDFLCAALMDSPGARSLTINVDGESTRESRRGVAAYSLVRSEAHPGPGAFPVEPGALAQQHGELTRGRDFRERNAAARAISAGWALRLTGDERLIPSAPVSADAADWVLRLRDEYDHATKSEARRVEVVDAAGEVRFRRSFVRRRVPASMFYFGLDAHGGAGWISDASFCVGREELRSGDRTLSLTPALLRAIKFSLPDCDTRVVARLRDEIMRTLDEPSPSPVKLGLARQYLRLFKYDAGPEDHPLIARIVGDARVTDIERPLRDVFPSPKKVPTAMRIAYAKRIVMEHSSAALRDRLAQGLASMPAGAFAQPHAAHVAIWEDPELYRQAAPFVACLADLDHDIAKGALLEALEDTLDLKHWGERRRVVNAVREGLIRLGPDAADAAPRVRELFLRRPSPIMSTSNEADEWRFALARMGVGIEDLPFFPTQTQASVLRTRKKIAARVARYEAG